MTLEEKAQMFRDVLEKIASLKGFEGPADARTTESLFFLLCKIRKIAKKAIELADNPVLAEEEQKKLIDG